MASVLTSLMIIGSNPTKLEYDRIYENTDNTLQFDKLYVRVFYSKDASFSLKLGGQALNLSKVGMFFTPMTFSYHFLSPNCIGFISQELMLW